MRKLSVGLSLLSSLTKLFAEGQKPDPELAVFPPTMGLPTTHSTSELRNILEILESHTEVLAELRQQQHQQKLSVRVELRTLEYLEGLEDRVEAVQDRSYLAITAVDHLIHAVEELNSNVELLSDSVRDLHRSAARLERSAARLDRTVNRLDGRVTSSESSSWTTDVSVMSVYTCLRDNGASACVLRTPVNMLLALDPLSFALATPHVSQPLERLCAARVASACRLPCSSLLSVLRLLWRGTAAVGSALDAPGKNLVAPCTVYILKQD